MRFARRRLRIGRRCGGAREGDVGEIRLFEQLILAEAAKRTSERRFNEAYESYLYLRREHPKLPGLEDAETALIIAEAEAALEAKHPELALARLLRLEQRNELHPQLIGLLART